MPRVFSLPQPCLYLTFPTPCTLCSLSLFVSTGVVLPRAVAMRKPTAGGRGALVIVAGGNSLGCTLHGTRRARARTSGFRARLATPGGRRTLKLRRKKGRKYLAPAGAPNMWNKAKRKNLK